MHRMLKKVVFGLFLWSTVLVSNCLVRDAPLASGKPWTLGNYTMEFGGVQVRGRCTFGIYIPMDVDEEEEFDIEKRDMEDMEVIFALHVQNMCIVLCTYTVQPYYYSHLIMASSTRTDKNVLSHTFSLISFQQV